jgi:hypothetical protein
MYLIKWLKGLSTPVNRFYKKEFVQKGQESLILNQMVGVGWK